MILTMNKFNSMRKISIFIMISFLAFSCKPTQDEPTVKHASAVNIKVARIKSDSLSLPVLSPGTLASKTQANLSFITGGIIRRFYVSEGEMVRAGELLASLDMTEIDSRARQAAIAVDKARRDFQRVENLYRDTVATLEQYQDARTALEFATANAKIAGFSKEHSEIRAPSDGKILKKLKEAGEIVSSGHPVLVFASTEAEWVLRVSLADRDIVRIAEKDRALVSFDAYPGREYFAEVMEIASAANLLSGTYEVEVRLIELPDNLVTGLIGQAKIYPAKKLYTFLPPEALVEAGRVGTRLHFLTLVHSLPSR